MSEEVSPEVIDPTSVIDARGKRCPAPVIEVGHRIGEIQIGAVLWVLADDPAAATDIPAWCSMRHQELLEARPITAAEAHALLPESPNTEPLGTLRVFRVRRTR